ncbi:unnamed protein product [Cuscuta campestris]|uniref:RNase H type-1 domain-containing protein n=1 Tax=Cuscuta campestris TaxID=132261 RepID=A0A484M5R3_9ASTE|nr:unnamed protein product [Cuscuta campestris]
MAPPTGRLKLNVDASFTISNQRGAAILRDENGRFVRAATFSLASRTPFQAEVAAGIEAISWALKVHSRLIYETGALDIIRHLSTYSTPDGSLFGIDVLRKIIEDNQIGTSHILREGNRAADLLAKEDKTQDAKFIEYCTLTSCTPNVIAALKNEHDLNAIFGAVDRNQFRLISNCTEAKRAWDILLITHEGTTTVKTAKLQIVMSKIENLKMEDAESITNFHGRVRELANEAERLGEQITENKLVLKVLRSLPEKYSMDVKAIRQTQSLNVMSLDELMGNLETIELEMHEDLRRKNVDGDSDSDVDPKEMLIIVEEKFQESLQVNKKKCLENESLKHELAESKRGVEQLIKELQRYKELVQANEKTVLENHQLVAERNRLKESISELEKKIEDLEGQKSDLKYELNQLKNFHKWMKSAGGKAIEEQVNISKFYGDKTGLGFSGSESNKTPLDLFVDRRKEIAQKVPQGRKTEAAASAGTSSAKPAEASHEASAGTIYAAPYAKRQRVVTQSSMRRHKDHYAKPERTVTPAEISGRIEESKKFTKEERRVTIEEGRRRRGDDKRRREDWEEEKTMENGDEGWRWWRRFYRKPRNPGLKKLKRFGDWNEG